MVELKQEGDTLKISGIARVMIREEGQKEWTDIGIMKADYEERRGPRFRFIKRLLWRFTHWLYNKLEDERPAGGF